MKYLLYCTKSGPYLKSNYFKTIWWLDKKEMESEKPYLNGTIVAECEVECEEITFNGYFHPNDDEYTTSTMSGKELMKASCLDLNHLVDYLGGTLAKRNVGYALHISNLKTFDRPLELNELFCNYTKNDLKKGVKTNYILEPNILMKKLEQAPQNMCWVWYKDDVCVLISIRPEWLCKILNHEKTIEIRRKVLREML